MQTVVTDIVAAFGSDRLARPELFGCMGYNTSLVTLHHPPYLHRMYLQPVPRYFLRLFFNSPV
jgi:hypothetical protein